MYIYSNQGLTNLYPGAQDRDSYTLELIFTTVCKEEMNMCYVTKINFMWKKFAT